MLTRLDEVVARWQTLRDEQADPEVFSDLKKLREVSRRLAELDPLVEAYKAYCKLEEEEAGARQVLEGETDPEMRAMAEEEVRALTEALAAREEQLKLLLLPVDPNDRRNVILEVRAGTGGEEAALFAAEIFRMYIRFAERRGCKVSDHRQRGRHGRAQGGGGRDRGRRRLLAPPVRVGACTGSSGCPRPRPRAASTPPPAPWP